MIDFQNNQIKLPDGSGVIVCRIKGSIDGSTLVQFEEKLLGFLEEGIKYLILVFSEVKYINSTGMGVLVKLADRFQEVGGEVNLVDVPEKLIALFNMLGLLALIKVSESEESAIKYFQGHRLSVSKRRPKVNDEEEENILPSLPKNPLQGKSAKKTYLIQCEQCRAKLNLGKSLRVGTYKCPRCMVFFKILPSGKLEFLV